MTTREHLNAALRELRMAMEQHPGAMALDNAAKAMLSAHAAMVRAMRSLGESAPAARARRCIRCGLLVVQLGAGNHKDTHDGCREKPKQARAPRPARLDVSLSECQWCGLRHGNYAARLECRARAERAARDVAVLR